jgi:nitronate monooxygenase
MLNTDKLQLPVIAAPMFLVSNPSLVMACCRAGIVGTFPALNQRTAAGFEQWLDEINAGLSGLEHPGFGVNLIVHKTNPRLQEDLDICVKHKVPLVITSLGAVPEIVEAVHSYGGLVFHDVINLKHAKKAASAGVDGLIAVTAGAGGHAGTINPFGLISEIKQFFDKTVLLSGCQSSGGDIAAAQAMGADFAYMGTRFICTKESAAGEDYKAMIESANAADIVYTDKVSGVNANFLKDSIDAAGMILDEANVDKKPIDFGKELLAPEEGSKAWKDIWSAGQGVGAIDESPDVATLVEQLCTEYQTALDRVKRYPRV